jgi:hypothetical protein
MPPRTRARHLGARALGGNPIALDRQTPLAAGRVGRGIEQPRAYLDLWRIFLLRRIRRRVRFFFHFHRMAAVAFFQGLDL